MADEFTNRMNITRGAKAVILDAKLPTMTDRAPAPAKIGGKVVLMAAKPKADVGKTKRMAAFKKAAAVKQTAKRPEMKLPPVKKAPARAAAAAKQPAGYVRLRLRVTDGDISVVGAQAVEGPLVESKLQGALAYEVTLGDRRVTAGAIPDAGEQRSFPDPKGRGEKAGHHVTQLRSYEVNVRVPKDEVAPSALPRMEIALYRVKEELPIVSPRLLSAAAIGPQFERELREVGRVKGLKPDTMKKSVAAQVAKAFK